MTMMLGLPLLRRSCRNVLCVAPVMQRVAMGTTPLPKIPKNTIPIMDLKSNHNAELENLKRIVSEAEIQRKLKDFVEDLHNPQLVFQHFPTHKLIIGYSVLVLCGFRSFVYLSSFAYDVFSHIPKVKDWANEIVRKTIFEQFCAGENEDQIIPKIEVMRERGIEAIFDYAAEGDVERGVFVTLKKMFAKIPIIGDLVNVRASQSTLSQISRVYDYKDETTCDKNLEDFLQSITRVKNMSPTGVTAVKLTALGQPGLLRAFSEAIHETQELFTKLDTNNTRTLTRQQMIDGFKKYFPKIPDDKVLSYMNKTFERSSDSNAIDYIYWTHNLQVNELWDLIQSAGEGIELTSKVPNIQERELLANMMERCDKLVEHSRKSHVKLLIDAEHLCFQPAIDNFVLTLQRKHNVDFPYIYQTYQCYRNDTLERLAFDLERSLREGWIHAAKPVRGAYMEYERNESEIKNYADPIHKIIDMTHATYNKAVDMALDANSYLLVATHNQASVIHTIWEMIERGMDPKTEHVSFAQLYGMADTLSETLARHGYTVYKYMPYGDVPLVIPYLIRRAIENSSISAGASFEKTMLLKELWRRLINPKKSSPK
eukprot:m.3573 g.3573  ORF g.3573 m.3573 type:complete len:598 (+) comp2090_c0_seq1:112-1905(+)